ncbi:fasciclin domain-containing protein [Phytomonospora sp. NPDC050363]|uniref:fasciclin domain-containing protein n=1 Tax=Phytomonospora sp. NPDC050363 TaxID=3155642 RepID=UPI0033D3124A
MRKTLTAVAGFALLFGAAACTSDTKEPASNENAAPPTAASSSPATSGGVFGPACDQIPTDPSDSGSLDAMAQVPTATAAAGNPLLSTLVTAVGEADLGDSLNTAPAITVFAPVNSAFEKIPEEDLNALLADKETLTSVLTYHVIGERVAPDALAGSHETLQGESVEVTGSGEAYTVNGDAMVVCGNVQTSNGTVYLIDTVLMPPATK